MSVSSTKVLKLTKKILKGNEQNPAVALQAIPAGSHVSLSATMLDVLVHMKHFGQIEIPKYEFTIRDGWLYCKKGSCTNSKILQKILGEVHWINGLSVGMLDDYERSILFFGLNGLTESVLFPNKYSLKHLVIYENIPGYEKGWPTSLLSIILESIGSLVTFVADEFFYDDYRTHVFWSLQYLKIRKHTYVRLQKETYFPSLMVLDIPCMTFPCICVKTMKVNTTKGSYCQLWGHAMHNLKRHRAAVYAYVKFTPLLSRDVARIIFRMVKAMSSAEWKLNEDDIPSKFKPDTSGNSKYIADVLDPEYLKIASNYQELVRLEDHGRFFQREVESLHKKRKTIEEDIDNYQDQLDKEKIKIQEKTEYVLPLIQQFLK